jgi:hypothetical protein
MESDNHCQCHSECKLWLCIIANWAGNEPVDLDVTVNFLQNQI